MPSKKAQPKGKPGRPTKYHDDTARMAAEAVKLGATDSDLAALFGVHLDTISEWKTSRPGFSEALKLGKAELDAQVEKSLFQRAMGYKAPAIKHFFDSKTGQVITAEYTEHYPPDPTSMIFWLKNRQPARWRQQPLEGEDAPAPVKVVVEVKNAAQAEPSDG